MSRADLILKLAVRKDKRTVPPVETGGHISYFFRTFSVKMKDVLKFNLLYIAIFCLPLIFSAIVLPLLVNNYVFAGKSYIGNFGIGFPNVADSLSDSIKYFYEINRFLVYPCVLLSFFIAFFGLSALFHVSRGLMWNEKVKTKSFFNGIRKLWKPFLITSAIATALMACVLYGIGWHLELMELGTANAGSWIVFILLILVGIFAVSLLTTLLPTFACYDFSFGDAFKNSVLLFCISPMPTLIISCLTLGIIIIGGSSGMFGYLLGAFALFFGIIFFTMMWTTYGQYLFDAFICPQLDENGNKKEVVIKKRTRKGDESVVKPSNPANKKKKNQNTYSSSYKRKPQNGGNDKNGKK